MYPSTRSSGVILEEILGHFWGYCYDGLAVKFCVVDSGNSRSILLQLAVALRCRPSGLKFSRCIQPFAVSGPAFQMRSNCLFCFDWRSFS